jgi:hypothetical protein
MFNGTLKDILTNILSLVMGVIAAVQIYLGTLGDQQINWITFIVTIVGAIVAWFTGKGGDGKAKIDL